MSVNRASWDLTFSTHPTFASVDSLVVCFVFSSRTGENAGGPLLNMHALSVIVLHYTLLFVCTVEAKSFPDPIRDFVLKEGRINGCWTSVQRRRIKNPQAF